MRRTEVQADWFQIKYEIDNAPHGTKGAVVQMWAQRLALSIHQLRARLRDEFGKAKNSPQPKDIDRTLVYLIAEMKIVSMRYGQGERELATWRCINRLKEMGVEGADKLTDSTVNRVLREELGFRDQPSYVRYECDYALQECQADWSFSKYFRVTGYDEANDEWIYKATSRALDYKKDDKRQRILLGVIMDSYSRIRYHRALIGTGESAELCLEFLTHFFNRPKDDLAFRHVGWKFRIDNGPLDSNLGKSFFDSIDREYETTLPYEKTGLGKAERGWQLVWAWEQELAMRLGEGGTITMSDYNELLLQECIRQQEEKHPFWTDQKKIDLYQQSILKQTPRPETIDVDARKIAFTVLERTVKPDQYVSIDTEKFAVPVMAGEYRTTGRRIRILINKEGRMIGELLGKFAPNFELKPYSHRSRGDFTGTPARTTQQQINKDLDAGLSGIEELRKGNKNSPLEKGAGGIERGSNRLMPKDKPLSPNSPFMHDEDESMAAAPDAAFTSKFEAMHHVAGQLKRHGIELKDELAAHFEECVINESLNIAGINAELQAFIQTYQQTLNQTGT